MSKLTAPLLSFSASGQIAKTMVASTWKGIPYMRKYVVPANPNTAAQQTQRGYVTSVVSAWKNYFTAATGRAAWARWATFSSKTISGFNAFSSQMLKYIGTDPDASFCNEIAADTGNIVNFTMLNLDDGTTGDEAGDFEIWLGATISGMVKHEDVAIVGGVVISTDLGDTDDVKYVKVRKGGYDRSGIAEVTLIV